MAKTVVGLFGSPQQAERVVRDLLDSGFNRDDISLTARHEDGDTAADLDASGSVSSESGGTKAGTGAATGATIGTAIGGVGGLLAGLGLLAIPGVGPIIAAGPLVAALTGAGIGAATGGLLGGLVGLGIPEEHAGLYAEGVRRGGYLVIVNASDDDADRAAEIFDRHDPIDIDEQSTSWRDTGWQGYDEKAPAYSGAPLGMSSGLSDRDLIADRDRNLGDRLPDESIPAAGVRPALAAQRGTDEAISIVEEELKVGKRAVAGGTVRVRSYVVERPVEADVVLREETVHVDRRAVDRPVAAGEAVFQERVIEASETDEEAVVAKEQRVVEEVIVSKDVSERHERVSDTVRKTEVEVDQPTSIDRTKSGLQR